MDKEVDEAIKKLKELQKSGDTESAHSEADKILLEFVPDIRFG